MGRQDFGEMRGLIAIGAILGLLSVDIAAAASTRVVPTGNRYSKQPKVPSASNRRTSAKKTTFDAKYEKVKKLLEKDRKLQRGIKKFSSAYKIDPIHMVGAIVGEHTFNVDIYDTFQSYLVKVAAYTNTKFDFKYDGENVMDFIERDEFETCEKLKGSFELWSCRENIWNTKFSGKKVDGKKYPKGRFSAVFFQPFYAGQTFGLGQINPLTALKLTDKVNATTRHKKIKASDARGVYEAIMDPNTTLTYMAASIRVSIDEYKKAGRVDISKNPGLTATLYNLGKPDERARKFRRSGRKYPRENYYGWFVNKHEKELRSIIAKW
jgi:hypothetical protein